MSMGTKAALPVIKNSVTRYRNDEIFVEFNFSGTKFGLGGDGTLLYFDDSTYEWKPYTKAQQVDNKKYLRYWLTINGVEYLVWAHALSALFLNRGDYNKYIELGNSANINHVLNYRIQGKKNIELKPVESLRNHPLYLEVCSAKLNKLHADFVKLHKLDYVPVSAYDINELTSIIAKSESVDAKVVVNEFNKTHHPVWYIEDLNNNPYMI